MPAAGTFPDWLLGVGGARKATTDPVGDAERQVRSLAARGVVGVGDIDAVGGAGTRGRRRAAVAGRSYLEIVGVSAAAARSRLARSLSLADRFGAARDDLGLSPHAPYSVHADVVPEIVRAARRRRLPLAMHLAETEEETRYLTHGDGPFVRFLDVIGKGQPFADPPRLRPVAYAERAGFLAAGGLVVHGNDLDDDDVERLARSGASVVYCHGTHRHFERPPHRFLELLEAGVNVALGTDSSASNEGVDLFAEMVRLCRDRPDASPLTVLVAAPTGGRIALGLDRGGATFVGGSPADGALLASPPDDVAEGPSERLAAWALSGEARVLATVHRGRPRVEGTVPSEGRGAFLDSLDAHG